MRFVTINPPKMLTLAKNRAVNPKRRLSEKESGALAISAPTMMTEETAFVTAINGECRAGVTFQTT